MLQTFLNNGYRCKNILAKIIQSVLVLIFQRHISDNSNILSHCSQEFILLISIVSDYNIACQVFFLALNIHYFIWSLHFALILLISLLFKWRNQQQVVALIWRVLGCNFPVISQIIKYYEKNSSPRRVGSVGLNKYKHAFKQVFLCY